MNNPQYEMTATPEFTAALSASGAVRFRFGVFEADLRNRELRKHGFRVKLQEKPFQVLELLLARPGELVTREALANRLWPGVYVSFERSLNTAVNALRRALCDSPRSARYIETRAGLGYVFVAPVRPLEATTESEHPVAMPPVQSVNKAAAPSPAYRDYLKGRYFCSRMGEDELHRGVAHLEAALMQDARFAPVSAGLADALGLCVFAGVRTRDEVYQRANKLSATALQDDAGSAEAHVSAARIAGWFDWKWAAAEASYARAVQLEPSNAAAHQAYANHLAAMGQFEQAIREMRQALQLDPMSLAIAAELAWILFVARDWEAAAEQSWQALALEPRFAPAQHTLGLAYEQIGMLDEAVVELGNAATCSNQHPSALAALAHAQASGGNTVEARRVADVLLEMARRRSVSPWWLSIVHAGFGENDAALECLGQALAHHDVWLAWLRVEPRLDPLRSDARFPELLQNVTGVIARR